MTRSESEVEERRPEARETAVRIWLKAITEVGLAWMEKQFVEQLQRVVEAEASRAGAAGDGALQLQAPVAYGAHAA
jgi:hypothetical protein